MRILRHKFNAKSTEVDNIKFHSKKESLTYKRLKLLQQAGEVLFFIRQVPLELPGNVIYRVDFLVFFANGTAEFWEVKGYMTPLGKLKIDQANEIYNINIKVI